MNKEKKKFIAVTAALSSIGLTSIILSAAYFYTITWTPFKEFNLEKNSEDTIIYVNYKSKVPVTTEVEYGTDPECLIKKEQNINDFKTEETVKIAHVLPEREHYIRIVAKTEDGKEFKSDFLKIK